MKTNKWAIIDDDNVFHLNTKVLIEERNKHDRIISFYDGKEAIKFFENNKAQNNELPDIILLELYLPVMDGWEFLEEFLPLRSEIDKDISIYIVSSSVNMHDFQRAYNINAIKKYIIKPLRVSEIEYIIEDVMEV